MGPGAAFVHVEHDLSPSSVSVLLCSISQPSLDASQVPSPVGPGAGHSNGLQLSSSLPDNSTRTRRSNPPLAFLLPSAGCRRKHVIGVAHSEIPTGLLSFFIDFSPFIERFAIPVRPSPVLFQQKFVPLQKICKFLLFLSGHTGDKKHFWTPAAPAAFSSGPGFRRRSGARSVFVTTPTGWRAQRWTPGPVRSCTPRPHSSEKHDKFRSTALNQSPHQPSVFRIFSRRVDTCLMISTSSRLYTIQRSPTSL